MGSRHIARHVATSTAKSAINLTGTAYRGIDKAAGPVFRRMTTDHLGIVNRLDNMLSMGLLDTLIYILLQPVVGLSGAVPTGLWIYALIAYGIPLFLFGQSSCLQHPSVPAQYPGQGVGGVEGQVVRGRSRQGSLVHPGIKREVQRGRVAPLNDSARRAIEEAGQRERFDVIFANPETGKAYVRITRTFYRQRNLAGITKMRIHSCCHQYADRVLAAGGSFYSVQMLLGHADPRVSQRYVKLSMPNAPAASGTRYQVPPVHGRRRLRQ